MSVIRNPRSVYYFYKNKPLTATEIRNNKLKRRFQQFFTNKQRYGATKIHQVLLKEGISVSLKHVQKLMKQLNLRSIVVKNIDLKGLINRSFQKRIS